MNLHSIKSFFLPRLLSCLAITAILGGTAFLSESAQAVDLLQEDFDDLTLNPIVTFYSELRDREAWTDAMPTPFNTEIWSVDNSNMPFGNALDDDIGVWEFEGWRVVDRDWWVNTAGGQGREEFVSASGSIIVADPDEWDDYAVGTKDPTDPNYGGKFDTTLRISGIDLQGISANTARLTFFSSWQPEAYDDHDRTNNQSASLIVKYNDPNNTEIEVLGWSSDEEDPNFKDFATNEFLNLPLNNPTGATSATLEFRLFNAYNDWWWAIDDIKMFDGTTPDIDGALRLVIDRDTNNVKIINNTGAAVDLRAYSIESANGALDESLATFLSDPNSISADPNQWVVLNNPDSRELSEGNLNYESLAAGAEIDLGNSWIKFYEDFSDIRFQYSVEGADGPQNGIVEFTGNDDPNTGDPTSYDSLDLNYDGSIDYGDYQEFLSDYGSVPSLDGLLLAQRHNLGDLNDDSKYSVQDFLEFQRQFDLKFGSGAFMAMIQSVPEPSTLLLFGLAVVPAVCLRKRRRPALLLVALVLFSFVSFGSNSAHAQLTIWSENFDSATLMGSVEEDPDPNASDWTHSFSDPNGLGVWTIVNNSNLNNSDPNAGNGVVEYAGWSFVSKDFWLDTADQGRSEFTRSSGNLLVADSDEWDDDGPEENLYDTTIFSPVIPIPAGIPASKIRIAFDSSWRDEADTGEKPSNQTGTLGVKYNGGAAVNLLTWESDPEGDDFHDDATNEGIELDAMYNGSSSTMQLQLFYGNARNDWFWGIDNIRVFVPADPSTLQIDLGTGEATFMSGDVIKININSIDIQSAKGSLLANPDPNTGFSGSHLDALVAPGSCDVLNNLGKCWQNAAANENYFSEFFLEGLSGFSSDPNLGYASQSLGKIFDTSTDPNDRDLVFTYTNEFGDEITGNVIYVGTPPVNDADFDASGEVDALDFLRWQQNEGTMGGATLSDGDANGDGNVDGNDLAVWTSQYGTSPVESAATAVPEPGGLVLLGIGLMGIGVRRRRRATASLPENCTVTSTKNRGEKRFSMAKISALAIACLLMTAQAAQAVIPAPSLDRDYNMGEDDVVDLVGGNNTPVSAGMSAGTTARIRDDAGVAGMGQIINMRTSFSGVAPTYQTIMNRPDGNSGLGILLNGEDNIFNPNPGPDYYDYRQHLETFGNTNFGGGGQQLALNLPIRSPSSTQADFDIGGTLDYRFITDRGFQLWAQPWNLPATGKDSYIVMDTNQHGVLIKNDGTFAMRYAGNDYLGVTQVTSADATSDPNSSWYHLMVVRPFGPGSGSILYVNGVAEAAATGTYQGETDLTAEDPNLVVAVDDSALVIGSNTAELDSQVGQNNYYSGMVDDLEMFVMGFNNSDDYGEFVFERDNKYAALFKPSVEGDLTNDGMVTMDDVSIFASNWLYEKRLEWMQGADERSLRVGDLSTRMLGDFDYSGRIDLRDWEILNDQNPALAAAAMALINGVPEPTTAILGSLALLAGFVRRGRRS